MSTRLIQIIAFANVGAGATVTKPHQLNVNDIPIVPDFAAGDAPGFTISATATQVSVTNNGSSPTSINVWLERKHTIPRELGALPDMTPQPFVVTTGSVGGGPSAPTVERVTPTGSPTGHAVADPTIDVTIIEGSGHAAQVTLADGTTDGFEKRIQGYITDGGIQITPAHFGDGTAIIIPSGGSGGVILTWDQQAGFWVMTGGFNFSVS